MTSSDSMTVAELKALLPSLDRAGDSGWVDTLEQRKQEEAVFHDSKVDRCGHDPNSEDLPEKKRANKRFYSTTEKSTNYVFDWIKQHVPGKVVLDYACGQGSLTREAARMGAALSIGLDVSKISVENAREDARREGVDDTAVFIQGDCEDTRLPDGCVDVILCSGMLHHLDVKQAFPEMARVLKPGGICLAVEALDYNPVVKLYRLITPELRTEWEKHHILSHKDLKVAKRDFAVKNVKYWHLFSIMATPLRRTPLFGAALAVGNALDAVVLKIPPLSYMGWQFTFELHKPAAGGTSSTSSSDRKHAA